MMKRTTKMNLGPYLNTDFWGIFSKVWFIFNCYMICWNFFILELYSTLCTVVDLSNIPRIFLSKFWGKNCKIWPKMGIIWPTIIYVGELCDSLWYFLLIFFCGWFFVCNQMIFLFSNSHFVSLIFFVVRNPTV